MEPSPKLPGIVTSKLRDFARLQKRVAAIRGLAEAILVFVAGVVLLALFEWLARPALLARVWLSGINWFVAGLWIVIRVIVPLVKTLPIVAIARELESAAKNRFKERVLSAVEMAGSTSQPGVSSWMISKTIAMAADELATVDTCEFVDRLPAHSACKRAGVVLLVIGLLFIIPGVAPRTWLALNPYASTVALSRIKLLVRPGNTHLKQGTALDIKVSAKPLPEQVKAAIQWDDGFKETVLLSRGGTNGDFVLSLPAVSQGFRYCIQAEDAETALFTVKVDVPPQIARIQLLIQPPAYTGLTNRVVEGGTADFLAGSRVRINLEPAGEKIATAQWISDAADSRSFTADKDRLVLDLQPTNRVSYQVRLVGENQLRLEPAQKWTLRPVTDLPPAVRLTAMGIETGVVEADEIIPMQAVATDDVGLKRVDLVVLGKDAAPETKTIFDKASNSSPGMGREFKSALNFNLADIKCVAGDEVQLQLVATDLQGQVTRSDPVSFTIGSRTRALEAQVAARLKMMVSAIDSQLDYLRQTRTSWLSIGRNYKDDEPAAQGPALTVLKSRLAEFGREINGIGNQLISESQSNRLDESRFIYMMGSSISAWGGQQRDVLLLHCSKLGQTNDSVSVLNQGRELFGLALKDLQQFRRAVVVLEDAFETDVMATRCDGAQGRYKRGLPVLYGDRGNPGADSLSQGSGLLATFFEGVNLDGRMIEQKVMNPRFDNYAPGGRRENWSVRYEGDLNIPDSGDWTLQCISDDGVRVKLDGKSLLAQEAWGAHGASPFRADAKLANGWHPVVIEFFQGTGESKLQFSAGKKGQSAQEVSAQWLRPPGARTKTAIETNVLLSAAAKEALKQRVRSGLQTPVAVAALVAPMTNDVENEQFPRLVRDKTPVAQILSNSLTNYTAWKPQETLRPEAQADDLTAFAREAQKILHDELNKYRWRYEGAQALKKIRNAMDELREISRELRQQPHNQGKRTEQEQAKIDMAKAWEEELKTATAEAEHNFFEIAKQKDATVAERVTALNAATKAEKELKPAVDQLASTLEEKRNKDEMASQMDQRLDEINSRYNELNSMQEKINYEQVAADARKSLPAVRAFERAQKAKNETAMSQKYAAMKEAVAEVQKDERLIYDNDSAEKLEKLSGQNAKEAKGQELFNELRGRANWTDNNPPSLAQTIAPAMREQSEALKKEKITQQDAANTLARPRLAMALEAARDNMQGDRRTAVAYQMLGQDMGETLQKPESISPEKVNALADRAAALAGQNGEEARQRELKSAEERLAAMKREAPSNEQALASQLEEMSNEAKDAAGNSSKQEPLAGKLDQMAHQGQPVPNWSESTDAKEIAASAANESLEDIKAAPKQWDSYNEASQILGDAARQIRMDAVLNQMADLNPFQMPESPAQQAEEALRAAMEAKSGKIEGSAGRASRQAAPKGIDQAEWARLNERLRQGIRGSGIENFSEEQQAAIRAYFQALGSEK